MTTHTSAPHSHRPVYYRIFLILMVLLVLTVFAAKLPLGQMNIIVAMGIAVAKAALIVLYFMHFKDSDHLTWLVGAATIAWFFILVFLTMNDYWSRDWVTSMPGK
jgi:cytochrome c oxidase subunit 4